MSFNNKIIKGLIALVFLLTILLIINSIYWKITMIESFAISFISGTFVSIFITCIQYKKEKNDIIYYYNNIIADYYGLLNNILSVLNSNNITMKNKYNTAKQFYDNYLKSHQSIHKTFELNLILKNLDTKYTKKIYYELYEYSNGVYLMKYFLKYSKNMIIDLNTFCSEQIRLVDEGMTILTDIIKIDFPWKEYKKVLNHDIQEHI